MSSIAYASSNNPMFGGAYTFADAPVANKVLALDVATQQASEQANRIWAQVAELTLIADALFGAQPQQAQGVSAAPQPAAPSARLVGLNDAQQNASRAIDALSSVVQRFRDL